MIIRKFNSVNSIFEKIDYATYNNIMTILEILNAVLDKKE
jgi:hypothetical protein